MESSDGKKCSVTVAVDDHRTELNKSYMKYIADCLRVDLDELSDVLDNWSQERLKKHLETHTAEQLKPPAARR